MPSLISLHTAITQGTANLLSLQGGWVGYAISNSLLDPHTRDVWIFSSRTGANRTRSLMNKRDLNAIH